MSWLSERTDESRGTSPPPSPFSAEAITALARLGIHSEAPLRRSSAAYARVLPVAESTGYHGALRQAFKDGEATPQDAESQLTWLAEHLSLRAPVKDDPWPWWKDAWADASVVADVPPPEVLGANGVRAFLDELLALPEYPGRLADALAVAFRRQAP